MPYWEFLSLSQPYLYEPERRFLRDGCLVMLLAMAWGLIEGSGSYLTPHLEHCRRAVAAVVADDENTEKLVRTVLLALDLPTRSSTQEKELGQLSVWVNATYVRGYFRSMLEEPPAVFERELRPN